MSTSNTSFSRSARCRTVLLASICALGLAGVLLPAARAGDTAAAPAASDQAPGLPLTATFEKGTPGERGGPFVLNLKNTSPEALKVHGKVLFSVAYHMNEKSREIAPHTIAAGETWTISDLAAGDKVTLKAAGYAPLELVVK
jgi:hypothetical protein